MAFLCDATRLPRPGVRAGVVAARSTTAALEQFAWADEHGFDSLVLSEHHGVDDGWMPGAAHDGGGGARRARSARA